MKSSTSTFQGLCSYCGSPLFMFLTIFKKKRASGTISFQTNSPQLTLTFQCRENYCNKPPATFHKRKNQWSNGNKYLCNVPFSEANLRHISSLIELRREIPGKQPQQRNFLKWLLVMNTFGEHLERLSKTSLL